MTIPEEQMAFVNTEYGKPAVYKKIPVKTPGPGEILIKVKYTGVCHSDVHANKGDWVVQAALPLVGGHEGVGEVVAKGDDVTDYELGDYAAVKWINGVCGHCYYCQDGNERICPNANLGGYNQDGSFQEYAIAKANAGNKIPKEIDLAGLAPVMCAGVTVYKGLKESGAAPGQYVAVVGAGGGLGSFAVQYAVALGLLPIAVDTGDDKRKACLEMGAVAYVDFNTSKSLTDDLKKATRDGQGPHAAIITSSEEEPFAHASDYVRPTGTVVIIGIPADAYIKSQLWDIVARLITIKGSIVGNRKDLDEAIEFYRRGLIKVPYQVVPKNQLNDIIASLDKNAVVGRYVLDMSA